jgi:hypothetical protein
MDGAKECWGDSIWVLCSLAGLLRLDAFQRDDLQLCVVEVEPLDAAYWQERYEALQVRFVF